MLEALKDHPFGVDALLERTVVLAFAVPADELRALLPSFLAPDTFQDEWGFVATALVRTHNLRPSALPSWCGQNFWLIGHRIFVRYVDQRGRRLRGLYILGSETDSRRMAVLGNTFTHYRYQYKPMTGTILEDRISLRSRDLTTLLEVAADGESVRLPADSVFSDWSEARRFVGPLPFTFSSTQSDQSVLIVEGSRKDWQPTPVRVIEHHSAFLTGLGLTGPRLSNAFMIDRVPYHWKKGIVEPARR